MRNKILSSVIFIALILAVGMYLYKSSPKLAQAPASQEEQQPQSAGQPSATGTPKAAATGSTTVNVGSKQLQGTFSAGESDSVAPNIQVWEVDFDGSKFTPASINIHVNDWVFFKNKSSVDFWPASGPHPTHTDYPGFDAGKAIAPGGEYKFQFTKVGSWSFHDHLDESIQGVVNVAQ